MGEDAALSSMVPNLESKTGRMLRRHHSLGHGYANLVAHTALGTSALGADGDALVEAQYAGKKAGLRPICDAVLAAVLPFGDDLEVAPKKGSVSLRRSKQFALVACTHQVRLGSVADVDEEVVGWLRAAWDRA